MQTSLSSCNLLWTLQIPRIDGYLNHGNILLKSGVNVPRISIMDFHPVIWFYSWIQWLLDKLLSPTPPPSHARLGRPRIAIIGAELTGVSAASHCVGHGFDVTIFEAGDEKNLGGIWSVS